MGRLADHENGAEPDPFDLVCGSDRVPTCIKRERALRA
jgi:hypothetical protein